MLKDRIIIFKNDAVGDLVHSLNAIDKIITQHKDHKIIIYLSDRSKKFSFLIRGSNIEFRFVKYRLKLREKFELFLLLFNNSIKKVYILSPKLFYFYLPIFFFKKKFYAICLNGLNNYKRPNEFLRKFLTKYVINDRSAKYKRLSTKDIQISLTENFSNNIQQKYNFENKNIFLNKYIEMEYAYFHIKASTIKKLGWSDTDLHLLFNEILKFHKNIFITRDIEELVKRKKYNFNYNTIDLKKSLFDQNNNSNIYLFDNIEGIDLFNLINHSQKVIAFHGMMTNLASLNKKKVLDLFFCEINNFKQYAQYRNSFYEFKPSYNGYDFTIPSKDISKTLQKIQFSINDKK